MKIKLWKNVFYLNKIQIVYFQRMILHKIYYPRWISFFFSRAVYIFVIGKIMQIPIFTFCKLMNNFTMTICSNIIKNGIYVCIYIQSYIRTPNISFKYYVIWLQLFCTLICRAKLRFINQNTFLTVAIL